MPLITEPENDDSYVVDRFQSPVIEFWRSSMVSQVLFPGGIEADLTYFDEETRDLAQKPVEFRKWFEAIDNWIRKNFVQLGIHVFAGPGAIALREDGAILQGR